DGEAQDYAPAWSPDGQQVVFHSTRGVANGDDSEAQLFVVNVDGSGLSHIDSGVLHSRDPDWSPDGRHIVFHGTNGYDADGNVTSGLFVIAPDGSGATQIADEFFGGGGKPRWSPDGRRIGWSRYAWDAKERLVVMNADGSNLDELIPGSFLGWSPTGEVILYRPFTGSSDDGMWVVRADGAGAKQLPLPGRKTGIDWAAYP
ncbi:MAG: hypothetical protein L0221_18465, partial [Chloroflexi bacterium]|nr:hypothetical protein [Chloroflexota bacterium]